MISQYIVKPNFAIYILNEIKVWDAAIEVVDSFSYLSAKLDPVGVCERAIIAMLHLPALS